MGVACDLLVELWRTRTAAHIIHVIFTLSTLSDGGPGLAAGLPYNLMTDSDYDG